MAPSKKKSEIRPLKEVSNYEPCPIATREVRKADVERFAEKLDDLLLAIRAHPRMQSDPHDSRTPGALFFVWDFVQRTRDKVETISTTELEAKNDSALEKWNDCIGRCGLSDAIISDNTGMMCSMMTRMPPVEFPANIQEKSKLCADFCPDSLNAAKNLPKDIAEKA